MNPNQDLQETLAKVRAAINKGVPGTLAKAFTQAATATSGITMYDLEPGARLLYPITTPLRNMIPRRVGGQGIQANWRSITAVNPSLVPLGLQEGKRGGIMDQTTTDNLAKFAFLGMDDNVTWQAQYAAEGFDDLLSLATTTLLQGTMEREERIQLGGNAITKIGATGTITAVPSNTGGNLAAAALFVGCAALTYEGVVTSSTAAQIAAGNAVVTIPYTRTNADGTTSPISGFFGTPSTAVAASITSSSTVGKISASVPAKPNAWGYAWYVGTVGALKLHSITSINSVLIKALPQSTNQNYTALGASDVSTDPLVFDGLVAQAYAGGGYVSQLATGTAGTGTVLTSSGSGTGGVAEIDTAIEAFFNTYRLVPDNIWISGKDQKGIQKLILNGNTNVSQFVVVDGKVIGGAGAWRAYRNPIGYGPETITINVHPLMPQGTILFFSSKVPYALTNVQDIVKMNLRRDYAAVRWPVTTLQYPFGVYFDGVLQHYFPASMGILSNFASS